MAVTVAVELLLTVPVVTLKVAVVALAATVTEAGVFRVALLSLRVTTAPPVGAAALRVTVQVLDAFDAMLVGLHDTDVRVAAGAVMVTVVFAELLL